MAPPLLVPFEEVQQLVLDSCAVLAPVDLPLAEACGHVLAEPVTAVEDVPAFDNTAMDGFAVRAADTVGGYARLRIVGTLAAGHVPEHTVGPGEAVRIMTGAPMPEGADAIVMVELTETAPDGQTVEAQKVAHVGDHVRRAGSDLAAGSTVCAPPAVITPGRVGMLASLGITVVSAFRRPLVGVLSTGDELVEGGGALRRGEIRDANRPALLSHLARDCFATVDLGIVRDREDDVRQAIETALERCDAVITSGGVSVGDFDYVKSTLDQLARARGGFMRSIGVAIRPAKPLAFGVVATRDGVRRVPVFGLPGNPVSSLVSYELFARPALRMMAGHADPLREPVRGRALEDLERHPDGKVHLARVVVEHGADGVLEARSAGQQGSHQLGAMAAANALALLPDGNGARAGGELDLLVLDWP